MFRDASQPVRSNKPTPSVCVIRLLIVIPPTTTSSFIRRPEASQAIEYDRAPGAAASYQSGSLHVFGLCAANVIYSVYVGTTSWPPKWIKPQLTRLVDEAPTGAGWLHEIKYDGYRMHARIDGGQVKLLTRTGLDWSHRYRRTIEALGSRDRDAAQNRQRRRTRMVRLVLRPGLHVARRRDAPDGDLRQAHHPGVSIEAGDG
jgi:hypothetical protein